MADEILRNSAALNALKRHQLVSLSKRYGLKASGKNVDLVQRLEDYAISHCRDLDFYIPSPAPTPGPNMFSDPPVSEPPTPFASHSFHPHSTFPSSLAPTPLKHKESMMSVQSRASDAWEMLSESGASLVSPKKIEKQGMAKSSSVSSWKSANNGEPIDEFGGHHNEQVSSTSSMKALAASLTRRGSRILLGRSISASSHLSQAAESHVPDDRPNQRDEEEQQVEEVVDTIPPSPASTVGVPRRHSRITLLERPSTVRLCSPTPASPTFDAQSDHEEDELPFFGKAGTSQHLKERRSMAPLRSSLGSTAALTQNGLSRKSMPALPSSTSASIASIYPPLPISSTQYMPAAPQSNHVPGSFPSFRPTPSQIVFGSNTETGVSNKQFSEAAQAILREMNAKLPDGGIVFGEELLKGKKAEIDKLVSVNKELSNSTGGWGLGSLSASTKDRYAEAHQKEFAKMRSISKTSIALQPSTSRQPSSSSVLKSSHDMPAPPTAGKRKHDLTSSVSSSHLIPSAPNGAPLTVSISNETRQAKRSRLSNGPNYLGSLRDAGRSIANLLGEEKGKSGDDMLKKMKERREKRRSSLIKSKGRGITSRFGFLRSKKASTAPAAHATSSTSFVMSPPIPAPTMPRKTSVYAPRELPHGKRPFDLEASLSRKPTATRRRSTDLSNVIKPHPQVLENVKSPSDNSWKHQKDRGRSTSAQTMLSQSSSQTPRRARIPDFAPVVSNKAALGSTNTLGLPKSSSMSSNLAMSRKASQSEVIRNARPAPPPPCGNSGLGSTRPMSVNRSSTLYLPTASSLARMQATIKPNPIRPLPVLPSPSITPQISTTVQPFGSAQSRENQLFASNFDLAKPMHPPATTLKAKRSQPAIAKSSAARIRARQSGLSAVKSKGNLREEMEVKRKRSEMRARTERREEEKGLREMLGEVRR
ncbi:uncharacterized protein IL334_005959 [Kwoniella shivajii]|uniref:SAP domain-containing protein n=1 Tax=Kwoniella shivajii TaxID=564305 RepID=A0ABZ1D4K7_9TREE|nr:hypothetical protein IL334_005959 [Kwoniella shivajii]